MNMRAPYLNCVVNSAWLDCFTKRTIAFRGNCVAARLCAGPNREWECSMTLGACDFQLCLEPDFLQSDNRWSKGDDWCVSIMAAHRHAAQRQSVNKIQATYIYKLMIIQSMYIYIYTYIYIWLSFALSGSLRFHLGINPRCMGRLIEGWIPWEVANPKIKIYRWYCNYFHLQCGVS